MKAIIASDLHGSLTAAKKLTEIIKNEKAESLILLGDLYYHGPRNPLPEEYAPMKVASILNSIEKIIVIRGNCDAEVDEMISTFPFSDSSVLLCNDKRIFLTHGHKYNEDNIPSGFDALIYGHFHTGFIKEKDGVLLANPGSLSLPKNGTEKSYLFMDDNLLTLKTLDGKIICSHSL